MQSDDGNSTDKFAELRLQAQAHLEKEEEGMGPLSPEEARKLIHELRTHQIELELQNEELRQTEEKLLAIQEKFSDLYDFVPVGYLTISYKGMIQEANLTAAVMLGVAREHLIMQPFSAFILPEDQDIYYRCRKELLDLKTTLECELFLVKKDGSPFPVLMKFSLNTELEFTPGQFRIVITDITEHKKIEAEREKLIVELQKAVTEIKTLQGLIPICMICKNIRNDKGAWEQLEAYIMDQSGATFTYGLCPVCQQKERKKIDQKKD